MNTPVSARRRVDGGAAPVLLAPSFYSAFLATVQRLGAGVAVRDPARDVELAWNDLRDRSAAVAGGLASLGVGRGDAVALLLSNRHEYFLCDLGATAVGAVPFSIYATSSPEEIAHVLNDAGARVAITETALVRRLEEVTPHVPALETVVVVDPVADNDRLSLAELEARGAGFDLSAAVEAIGLGDPLTLIYTSGTTGPPKGVELTHRNLMGLIGGVESTIPLPLEGALISWLPAAHIAERAAHYYLPFMRGLQVTICPDPAKIIETLAASRPSWFFAVPRIWEKLRAGIEAKFAALPEPAATAKVRLESAGEPVPEELAEEVRQADTQQFAPIRASIGLDRAVTVSVGAAPTPPDVLEFCAAIGLPIGEMWGLSETCGVVTCNVPGKTRFGTVGLPLPGYEIELADDGEVLVRGPGVTAGYRNRPDATAAAIDADGWFATGDIGELDADGYLKIIDRKKELIINSAGKNMSPAQIESKLKAASPLIGQAVAIGDRRPYNVALIVLDPEYAQAWASKYGIEDASPAALSADDRVTAAIQNAVDGANARLARVEQIKSFHVLPVEWEPGGAELTPTMKLKRKPIAAKYAVQIDSLYTTGTS